jgi:hypothetical protein
MRHHQVILRQTLAFFLRRVKAQHIIPQSAHKSPGLDYKEKISPSDFCTVNHLKKKESNGTSKENP